MSIVLSVKIFLPVACVILGPDVIEYRVRGSDVMITYGWGETEEEAIRVAAATAKLYEIPLEGMVLIKYTTTVTTEELRTL